MRLDSAHAIVAAVVLAAALAPVSAAGEGLITYQLAGDSSFQQGCFPPCHCPITAEMPVRGSFVLGSPVTDGEVTTFELSEVLLAVDVDGKPLPMTGAGSYRVVGGDEPSHQLILDLSVERAAPERFDSGVVLGRAALPEIVTTLSINQLVCYDRVLRLHAAPVAQSGRAAFVVTSASSSMALSLFTGGTTTALAGSLRLSFAAAAEAAGEVDVRVESVDLFATGFDPILPGVGETKHFYQDPDRPGVGVWNPQSGGIAFDLALVAADGNLPVPMPLHLAGVLDRDGLRVVGSNGDIPDGTVEVAIDAEVVERIAEARRPIAAD